MYDLVVKGKGKPKERNCIKMKTLKKVLSKNENKVYTIYDNDNNIIAKGQSSILLLVLGDYILNSIVLVVYGDEIAIDL